MTSRQCCCIPDQSKLDKRCPKRAAYQIWHGPSSDDYTEACDEHLAQLLNDCIHFEIQRIPPEGT